jgi:hypothetical protein
MERNARFARLAAAWALLIFGLSSIPGASFPASKLLSYDKLLHAGVYAVLGGLCFLALRRRWPQKPSVLVLVATALSTLYGITDEFHQSFVPGRSPDVHDVLADCVGALVGAVAMSALFTARVDGAGDKAERPAAKSKSAS